jgi:hypothetical protein
VIVLGAAGIGKASVVKKIGLFYQDRNSFDNGIIYCSFKEK